MGRIDAQLLYADFDLMEEPVSMAIAGPIVGAETHDSMDVLQTAPVIYGNVTIADILAGKGITLDLEDFPQTAVAKAEPINGTAAHKLAIVAPVPDAAQPIVRKRQPSMPKQPSRPAPKTPKRRK